MAEVSAPTRRPVRFGSFELDVASGELRKAGVLVSLQDQSLKALVELVERPGELVTRDRLRQRDLLRKSCQLCSQLRSSRGPDWFGLDAESNSVGINCGPAERRQMGNSQWRTAN